VLESSSCAMDATVVDVDARELANVNTPADLSRL
jgi:CTP:molybdopterin cytidylyltransferase MocA